jgi:phosphotransferase system HPr-like phosphotransfer protein
LVIEAVGRDAEEALDALATLIDHNFAEDERAGEEQTS